MAHHLARLAQPLHRELVGDADAAVVKRVPFARERSKTHERTPR
jgi:hypothetical protein